MPPQHQETEECIVKEGDYVTVEFNPSQRAIIEEKEVITYNNLPRKVGHKYTVLWGTKSKKPFEAIVIARSHSKKKLDKDFLKWLRESPERKNMCIGDEESATRKERQFVSNLTPPPTKVPAGPSTGSFQLVS